MAIRRSLVPMRPRDPNTTQRKSPCTAAGGVRAALVGNHKRFGRPIVDIAGAAQNNGRQGRRPSSQPESSQEATCVFWGVRWDSDGETELLIMSKKCFLQPVRTQKKGKGGQIGPGRKGVGETKERARVADYVCILPGHVHSQQLSRLPEVGVTRL